MVLLLAVGRSETDDRGCLWRCVRAALVIYDGRLHQRAVASNDGTTPLQS